MYDFGIIIPINCHKSEPLYIQYLLCVRYWIIVDFVVEEK